jgi:hypothetical protein
MFTYFAQPTVGGISPTSGPATGGTTVTITGTGLSGARDIDFGSHDATSFTVNSGTSITATSPGGSGTVDVTVRTPGGTSATSAADKFTYVVATPTVTAVVPGSGPASGGTVVRIVGTGFGPGATVDFGTVPAATVVWARSSRVLTAISPAGSGTVDVTVTTSGGTSATSTADRFTYVARPTVTGISPKSGTAGTTVTITGTGFTGWVEVSFGGAPAQDVMVNGANTITVVAPAGKGTVDVTVTTEGGTSATSSADNFTYSRSAHHGHGGTYSS